MALVQDTVKWEETGKNGDHGRIYYNPETGELAEEYEGSRLVELEPAIDVNHYFLLEQEHGHDNRGW